MYTLCFCTFPKLNTPNAKKILSRRCWNVLYHQGEVIWFMGHSRNSQQYGTLDKKKKIKRRAEKIVVRGSQIYKRIFQRNIIHIHDDVAFYKRTTRQPVLWGYSSKPAILKFILPNEHIKELRVPRRQKRTKIISRINWCDLTRQL